MICSVVSVNRQDPSQDIKSPTDRNLQESFVRPELFKDGITLQSGLTESLIASQVIHCP